MTAPWSLPGYELQAPLGHGGQVWRAREQATGELVALRRLRTAPSTEALHHAAAVLGSLDTPYLVRLRDVVEDEQGTVLVVDLAAGGSLAALLSRRGRLDPGEVVTIAVPVAQALAVAHDSGVLHGGVSPSTVLLTAEGMPLLSGLGTWTSCGDEAPGDHLDPVVAAGGPASGASDVWSLAAVCHSLLTGSPPDAGSDGRVSLGTAASGLPRAVVDVVEAALVHDPALRPDAAAFAQELRRAHAAQPVRFDAGGPALPGAQGSPPPLGRTPLGPKHAAASGRLLERRPRLTRRPPRWLATGALGAGLLVAAAALGWWWGQAEPGTSSAPAPIVTGSPVPELSPKPVPEPVSEPVPEPVSEQVSEAAPDWADLIGGLDAGRAQAFAAADPARLEAVYAPGAPGLAADRALVDRLVADGVTAAGVRHEVRAVDPVEVDQDRARLRVVDVLAAHELRDAGGAVVARVPARPQATYLVELSRTPDGWRLVQVTPA